VPFFDIARLVLGEARDVVQHGRDFNDPHRASFCCARPSYCEPANFAFGGGQVYFSHRSREIAVILVQTGQATSVKEIAMKALSAITAAALAFLRG
jgi:hypothetical protein